MIRCVRLWTGDDQNSYFEEGVIELKSGPRGDWLSGTLEFETPDGRFTLRTGDILFTEDTSGAGHNWKMVGSEPWCRVYTTLDPKTVVPFRPAVAG